MIKLQKLQNIFYDYLLAKNDNPSEIASYIKSNQYNEIYCHIYRQSMLENIKSSLRNIFCLTNNLLEQDCNFYVEKFVLENPVKTPFLIDYGNHFPDFLANELIKSKSYIAKLAKFEWIWHRVFFGENNKKVNLSLTNQIIKQKQCKVIFNKPNNLYLMYTTYDLPLLHKKLIIKSKKINIKNSQINKNCLHKILKKNSDNKYYYTALWQENYEILLHKLSIYEYNLLLIVDGKKDYLAICKKYFTIFKCDSDYALQQFASVFTCLYKLGLLKI